EKKNYSRIVRLEQIKFTSINIGGKLMSKIICQIIDSSGNLPRDIIERYNISETSFYFKFKDTDYMQENVDYETNEFFEHMEQNPNDIPKTSAPNIYDWLSLFQKRYASGARKFIVTTISEKL